jgi:hypothetical protein
MTMMKTIRKFNQTPSRNTFVREREMKKEEKEKEKRKIREKKRKRKIKKGNANNNKICVDLLQNDATERDRSY